MKTDARCLPKLAAPLLTAVLLALTSCAAPQRVTLLPQADGTPSALVVRSEQGELTLAEPYASASLAKGQLSAEKTDEATIRERYKALLAAQPPQPRVYLLYFATGGERLVAESEVLVATIVRDLQQTPAAELLVIGHTDRVGSDEANDQLSLSRANAIRTMLTAGGVPVARIETVGRGERAPLVPTADGVAEAKNRRVEVRLR